MEKKITTANKVKNSSCVNLGFVRSLKGKTNIVMSFMLMLFVGTVFFSCDNSEDPIPLSPKEQAISVNRGHQETRASLHSAWNRYPVWIVGGYGTKREFSVGKKLVLITATKDTGTQADCYLHGEWLDSDTPKSFDFYLDSSPGVVRVYKIQESDIYGEKLELKLRHQGQDIGKIGAIVTVAYQ